MRKETAWAIGMGIIFGLVLAFGLWRINISVKNTSKPSPTTQSPTITPIPTQNVKISINTPENGDVFSTNTTNIVGISNPNSKVIISVNKNDYLTQSDNSGVFTKEVELTSGVNQISASSISDENTNTSNVLVVYSASFEGQEASASATLKSKAYIGTVTDITDNSIQIKTLKNEIRQIAVLDETNVINIKETASKQAKLGDIAIGDFIATLGQISSTLVLNTTRILIINPITEPVITVKSTKYIKGDLKTDKNTLYYEFINGEAIKSKSTSLKEDMDIIYTQVDSLVRTVFVIPSEVQ